MVSPLPAELALAAVCCSWPPSPSTDERIRATSREVADWTHFDAVVRRNRITPLVHRALARAGVTLPEPIEQQLSARAAAAARRALVMARECVRLQRAFDTEGIPFMIVKGVPIAILAYGDLGLKEYTDNDLLVSPEFAVAARRLLVGLGYEMNFPKVSLEAYVEHGREAMFSLTGKGIIAELHWHLMDHRGLLNEIDVHSPAQSVALPGGTLRTLADEPLFAFLCLHGAAHNWSRLKWLADLSAFVATRPEPDIERLHNAAQRYRAGRSASVALLLCQRLFGLALSDDLMNSLERNSTTRALEANVLGGLAYRGGAAEHVAYAEPWLRAMTAKFFVEPGAAPAFDRLRILWTLPGDRGRIALPRHLTFLYHLLRVPLWLGRIGRRSLLRRRT